MPDTDDLLSDLVPIPPGEFQMGSSDGPEDERPVHSIRLDAFAIGRHQLTHRHYARFVRDTGHRPPAVYELPLVVTAGGEERERAFRASAKPYVWTEVEPPEGLLEHPVNLVRWDDAAAYCAWLSAAAGRVVRLPFEAEWEMAARDGLEGKRYPWDDRLETARGNFGGPGLRGAPRHDAGRKLPAQRFRPVRHDRQCLGMGPGLVRGAVLRCLARSRPARPAGRHP